jgi:ribosomal protein L29
MKNRMNLGELNNQELYDKLEGLRKEFFLLRLNAATAHIKDYSQFKKLRKSIARALTALEQRREQ